ncbi:MAG: outer membrane lipoprotein LolB [Azoarcus sp.]|jgi:outer membrane lipoprotein LolB|nr:outer membrane lipoprotein LolB [Azoarcus sp.]
MAARFGLAVCVERVLRTRAAILAAAAFTSACALNPPAPPADAVPRQAFDAFSMSGRLSASDGKETASGRLDWAHRPDADRWTISGPFGQVAAQIDSGPDGAEVVLASGERQSAPQVVDLILILLPGASEAGLPPERLVAWVQAAPPDGAEVRTFDAQGRPARLIDKGWIVDYLGYRDETPEAMPRLVDISRGEFRLRLVVDRWEMESP